MTRTTNARIAGATFLLYIALGVSAMVLLARATAGDGAAAKLASVAAHESSLRVAAVLNLFCGFAALVLAVTLYGITRDEDRELAMLGLVCRTAEGVVAGVSAQASLGLLWLAAAAGASTPAAETARTLGAFFMGPDWGAIVAAAFFAVGSTSFCWLLLRARTIPAPLAWLGLAASVVLVLGLPLRIVGLVDGWLEWVMWLPMLLFEVPLGLWLLVRGVGTPPMSVAPPIGLRASRAS
jgi:hypothetical protein